MGIKADKGAGFGVGYVDVRNLTLSVDFNGGTVRMGCVFQSDNNAGCIYWRPAFIREEKLDGGRAGMEIKSAGTGRDACKTE